MPQSSPGLEPRNLLAGEASPYLRQHASNPVYWRPWNEAALEEARTTGKPILLSIGYSACHWCHVMAHESFEDPQVADVMNRLFVNIKVDREERPDIDQIYMTALTAMGEQGGWPMTMFLTPDGEPFWGGTYFPRQARYYGRPGFIDILNAVHRLFTEERQRIVQNVEAIRANLAASLAGQADRTALSPTLADDIAARIAGLSDPVNGGIRGAPKFPNAPFMEALWLSWLRTGNAAHRDACLVTWRRILDGGIYDHVGGGMARYSVDNRWLVPHFEKMLYDNAQMIRHALWAWHATGDELFRIRIEETVGWLAREMALPSGAFASSLDADSEGEEGRFYVWSADELRSVLGTDYELFASHYDVSAAGNWEGRTIINRLRADGPTPRHTETEERLALLCERLLAVRSGRVRPGRDDKALTDWNGLTIRALAEAGRTLDRGDWITLARRAYSAVMGSAQDDRLPHSVMSGAQGAPGLASDHAAMINAAVSLYEATSDSVYLDDARRLHGSLERWHAMGTDGYSQTATDRRDVILHIRGDQDDATPSATAQIIEAIARLATVAGDEALAARGIELAEFAVGRALEKTFGHIGIINAATIAADPWKLVLVEPEEGARPLSHLAAHSPDPRRCDVFVSVGASPVPLPAGTVADTHGMAAFLCRRQRCLLPVHEAASLREILAGR